MGDSATPHYLERTCSTIRTDHDALHWILNLADATAKLPPWRIALSKMDFDVIYPAGTEHLAGEKLL